jgi:chromosomal replication initiation ATPase DnaA
VAHLMEIQTIDPAHLAELAAEHGRTVRMQIHQAKIEREHRMAEAAAKVALIADRPDEVVAARRTFNQLFEEAKAAHQAKEAAYRKMAWQRSWQKMVSLAQFEANPQISIATILHQVAHKHGVTVLDIKSPRRFQNIVNARQEAFYRARHETALSLPQIGMLMGNKDHTTVLHGVKAHTKRMEAGK